MICALKHYFDLTRQYANEIFVPVRKERGRGRGREGKHLGGTKMGGGERGRRLRERAGRVSRTAGANSRLKYTKVIRKDRVMLGLPLSLLRRRMLKERKKEKR